MAKTKNIVPLRSESNVPATKHVFESRFKKSTPGTFVFENLDDDCVLQTAYIKKFAFDDVGHAPKAVRITVEVIE